MSSLVAGRLRKYRDLAWLLMKHGRSDLVRNAGLELPAEADADSIVLNPSAAADARELTKDLEKLGPTFVKLGQLLSTRPDLLPAEYVESLRRLQDDVDPFPYSEVRRIVTTELGASIPKLFETFDRKPLAAASLSQVHHARLKDGREVAVKVQRPDVRERVVRDIEALGQVARFLDKHTDAGRKYEFQQIVEEFRKTLLEEIDFRQEARNMVSIGHNLADFERILVPQPIEEFTTSRVLTMNFVKGSKSTDVPAKRLREIDAPTLADDLLQAYLQQILLDGLFHADPHPGNVWLTDDGQLALLDLGMVSRITPRMQEDLLKILMAISEGEAEEAARIACKLGEPRESFDEAKFFRAVGDVVLRVRDSSLEQIRVGKVVLDLTRIAVDHGLHVVPELTLLGKTLMNLDEVTLALDPEFDPTAALRKHAPAFVQRRLIKDLSTANVFSTALELKDFVQLLPSRVNKILDALTKSELRLKVEMIDEGAVIDGLQKVANRIALGLILAALIVGAAMLMRVDTPFRILGYPGLAILFFIAAASGGLWLAITILSGDRAPRRTR